MKDDECLCERREGEALKAGKHVGHEVSGVQTEDECWAMVQEKVGIG
jgi:hypothetical protein